MDAGFVDHFEEFVIVAVIDVDADDDGAGQFESSLQHRSELVGRANHQTLGAESPQHI
jgi:hypothetical protein